MHIKKQDLLNTPSAIQRKDNDQLVEQERIPLFGKFQRKIEHKEKVDGLGIDRVRSQVFTLHNEVKDLQTRVSNRQIQISFLETLRTEENWKNKLETFMKDEFNESIVIKPDPDIKSYIGKLNLEIKILNSDLFTREVKLENIISSGIIDSVEGFAKDPEKADGSQILIKDIAKAREVFSRIKSESIGRILKS